MIVKRTVAANVIVLLTRIRSGRLFWTAGVCALIGTVKTKVVTRTVLTTVHFTVVLVDTLMQVLVQVNIIVVIVLVAVIVANFTTAIVRRRTVRVGQIQIHRALIVTEAVRKVQSIRVALIK